MKSKFSRRGFTLVELIVVIAIIAVLAVTAFLLLTKWIAQSRDSRRLADMSSIQTALEMSIMKNTIYPAPDNSLLIYASGVTNVVGYQGDLGDNAVRTTDSLKSTPKDPLDNLAYSYYVSAEKKEYQLLYYTENTTAYNTNIAYGVDYSKRTAKVAGDKLGILVDPTTNVPVHRLGLTGLELSGLNTSYISKFDNITKVTGTGQSLITVMTVKNKNLVQYDNGLVLATDMESTAISGTVQYLRDRSSSFNKGILSGGVNIGIVGGIKNNATFFNGINQNILYPDNPNWDVVGTASTISVWVKFNYVSSDQMLVAHDDGGGLYNKWFLRYRGGTKKLNVGLSDGVSSLNMEVDYIAQAGPWYNFVVTNIGNNYYFYVNGNYIGTTSSNIKPNASANLTIGNGENWFWTNGFIDEVRIYNRALSDDEVRALYLAQ